MKIITCVIENTVQRGSSFWGEHGLAFYIEIDDRSALFDTGHSEPVLLHNFALLGKCPRDADALILSHAHTDHTGALAAVLAQKPSLPVYASPDLFRPRFARRGDHYESIGLRLTQMELSQQADLRLNAEPVEVLPGLWTTGEIRERPEREGSSVRLVVPHEDGWQPDPYRDDMSLVMETNQGLVVICGCCHAGLLNTLAHVRRMFQRPIIAIIGGTHLESADIAYLQHITAVLSQIYGSPRLYLNHCTGEQAFVVMANAFGELVKPCPVGTSLSFD
jgi:7,8-dihydropterin-6-yl-methyl-4-(beta-D-ribofuranosyl)aminobenzene 5'-phosphate synthase